MEKRTTDVQNHIKEGSLERRKKLNDHDNNDIFE